MSTYARGPRKLEFCYIRIYQEKESESATNDL